MEDGAACSMAVGKVGWDSFSTLGSRKSAKTRSSECHLLIDLRLGLSLVGLSWELEALDHLLDVCGGGGVHHLARVQAGHARQLRRSTGGDVLWRTLLRHWREHLRGLRGWTHEVVW